MKHEKKSPRTKARQILDILAKMNELGPHFIGLDSPRIDPTKAVKQSRWIDKLEKLKISIESVDHGYILAQGVISSKKAVASSKDAVLELVAEWLDAREAEKASGDE